MENEDRLRAILAKMAADHERERRYLQSRITENDAIISRLDRDQQALLRAWALERERQRAVFEDMAASLSRLTSLSAMIKK